MSDNPNDDNLDAGEQHNAASESSRLRSLTRLRDPNEGHTRVEAGQSAASEQARMRTLYESPREQVQRGSPFRPEFEAEAKQIEANIEAKEAADLQRIEKLMDEAYNEPPKPAGNDSAPPAEPEQPNAQKPEEPNPEDVQRVPRHPDNDVHTPDIERKTGSGTEGIPTPLGRRL